MKQRYFLELVAGLSVRFGCRGMAVRTESVPGMNELRREEWLRFIIVADRAIWSLLSLRKKNVEDT